MVEELVEMIATAFAPGAASATKDRAPHAVKDAYEDLKGILSRRFCGNTSGETGLSEAEKAPETWKGPLAKSIDYVSDDEVFELARRLMDFVESELASRPGDTYNVMPVISRAR